MPYLAYGWPRALAASCQAPSGEAVYIALGADYLVVVYAAAIQIWTGGQHRMKIGELVRNPSSLQEEGGHVRAYWCPGRKCLAVLTDNNHLLYYGLLSSKEALWRFPDGREVKKVSVYLQNSLHLDYRAAARVVDLTGDSRSLVAVLSSGALQVFSWQGELRGQANPFTAVYEGSRGRLHRARSNAAAASAPSLHRVSSSSAGAAGAAPSPSGQQEGPVPNGVQGGLAGSKSAALDALARADSLLLPTPIPPQEVVVRSVHWAPSARLLAIILEDGRCALCRTPDAGMQLVEQVHFIRWVYKPSAPSVGAVAAAINPTSHMLALGLAHGRVAIYTLQSLLAIGRRSTAGGLGGSVHGGSVHGGSVHGGDRSGSVGSMGLPPAAPSPVTAGQPDPVRVLSLTDWGYSSTVTGGAVLMQWAPDGRVLAVGYGRRGMAVWTPSGCRLMCSLRQAAPAAAHASAALQPGLHGVYVPATPRSPTPRAPRAGGTPTFAQAAAAQQQQQQPQHAGVDPADPGAVESPASPTSRTQLALQPSMLHSQSSLLNMQTLAAEIGVLEGPITALCWGPHGYQLLVAERGEAAAGPRLCEQDFARFMPGQHRVAAQAQLPLAQQLGFEGQLATLRAAQHGVHALQAADRVLVITESQPSLNPALAAPTGAPGAAEPSQRPDLALQHVRVPQQYLESNYPLMHAAISQDRGDIAVAGARGLAVYARRAQRWRMFGDVAQERQLRVQRLVWLPGGAIAACAHVDSKEAGGAAQLLLYPRHHLDNASLMARAPLHQMPLAVDSAGSCLLLAFAPLELRVVRVELERAAGAAGPGGQQAQHSARLTTLRELSIMGMSSPLQEIALVEPDAWHPLPGAQHSAPAAGSGPGGTAPGSELPAPQQQPAEQQQPPPQQEPSPTGSGAEADGLPRLRVATKRPDGGGAAAAGPSRGPPDPTHCVLLRAGGVMSLLNMDQGTEQVLSDEIERFWLPASTHPTAHLQHVEQPSGSAPSSAAPAAPSQPAPGTHSRQRSAATSAQISREGSLALGPSEAASEAGEALSSRWGSEAGAAAAAAAEPHVEMPWWTYGARGMQLWFPSLLSDPITPKASGGLLSPTSAAAACSGAANSTDPELEFDREVYPIGVSLAEVSIIGVTQRSVRSNAFPPASPQSLCFHPLPESQPVLPCLLRRLLQKGKLQDAQELARLHSGGPHFSRSLEWLLFTALELDSEQQREASVYGGSMARRDSGKGGSGMGELYSPRSSGPAAKRLARAGPLLMAAAQLVQQFPQYAELVVSVARKTDAQLWPSLFAAVGSPAALGEGLRAAGDLQSAACCLLLVDHIEGTATAHALALRLIRAALKGGQYELVAELLRFLLPPGESEALLATLPLDAGSPTPEPSPRQPPPQQQPPQQPQQQAPSATGWLWGLFGGGSSAAPVTAAVEPNGRAAGAGGAKPAKWDRQQGEGEPSFTPVVDACRLIARHAWKLLDAGALRQLVSLAVAVSSLPGGLAMLMRSCTRELALAGAHMEVSAPGVASALFVAVNEFPSLDTDRDAAAAAASLLELCRDAGCASHAAALALLLGDEVGMAHFREGHPQEAAELAGMLAKDAYLGGFVGGLAAGAAGGSGGGSSGGGGDGTGEITAAAEEGQAAEAGGGGR